MCGHSCRWTITLSAKPFPWLGKERLSIALNPGLIASGCVFRTMLYLPEIVLSRSWSERIAQLSIKTTTGHSMAPWQQWPQIMVTSSRNVLAQDFHSQMDFEWRINCRIMQYSFDTCVVKHRCQLQLWIRVKESWEYLENDKMLTNDLLWHQGQCYSMRGLLFTEGKIS